MILDCRVWCQDGEDNENLGIQARNLWIPISIDLTTVVAVKLSGPGDFIGKDKAVLYMGGHEPITIDKTYKEVVQLWKDSVS
jgi:hypothetical protein